MTTTPRKPPAKNAAAPQKTAAKTTAARKTPAKKTTTSRQPTYTDATRRAALDLYVEHGPRETERRTGIPHRTISRWAADAGLSTDVTSKTAAATEQAQLSVARRKLDLAGALLDDVTRLRAELFAPTVERVPMRVGVGDGIQHVQMVDVTRQQPTFVDQKQIMVSIGIAVDKIVALTGPWAQAAAAEPGADAGVDEVAATVLRLVTSGGAR